ncbi:MAG: hypothetical protein QG573_1624 [Acidobacteriota bacterium]|nr:hypothetical protein [Acidobacteriota bacterium]
MRRDDSYLLDMLLRSRDALRFSVEAGPRGLADSTMAQFAVLHALQIVGEAAAGVSEEVRRANPGIPWAEIVGMRHRIVHDYGRVNMEVVRQVLERDLPALILQLEGLVRPDDEV